MPQYCHGPRENIYVMWSTKLLPGNINSTLSKLDRQGIWIHIQPGAKLSTTAQRLLLDFVVLSPCIILTCKLRPTRKMARPVENRHGIAAMVIGAMEIVFGIIIMACSFAVGAKISGNSSVSPYWAGIPVSYVHFGKLILIRPDTTYAYTSAERLATAI